MVKLQIKVRVLSAFCLKIGRKGMDLMLIWRYLRLGAEMRE